MGAAGVFGNVAAQAARPLAGRVGGVPEAEPADVGVQVQVYYAGLHRCGAVLSGHLQDSVHAGEGDLDASRRRNGASAEACGRAATYHRHPLSIGQGQHTADLLGGGGQAHCCRQPSGNGTVVFVDQQVFGVRDYVPLTGDGLQLLDKLVPLHLGSWAYPLHSPGVSAG